ncbi:cysteine desulfurase [bacterium]|nr:cysteine desulfurase [bacterium]
MENRIYLDNAAASRTDPEVVRAMLPYFDEIYAVASSQFSHTPGILAREALDRSREILARRIAASPEEILFTSGGTESNNLAVKGAAWAARGGKKHLVCSKIEHPSVLHSCQWLEKQGFGLTTVRVDGEGFVDLDHLEKSIRPDTLLVSIQHGNQEVGTIQPLDRIAGICRKKGALLHTDASFSFTQADLDLSVIPADLVTLSAHRIHGPKGIGALYVRKGTPIEKMMHGGYHEYNLRSGTENVAGAVGFARAVELSGARETARIRALQRRLFERLAAAVDDFRINGPEDMESRLPGNVNVSFDRVEGESVVLHLDMKGISVITGSACFSRSLEPSAVMMAMGFSHERAHGSIRFTLSRFNTEEEMDRTAESSRDVVEALRKISPLSK